MAGWRGGSAARGHNDEAARTTCQDGQAEIWIDDSRPLTVRLWEFFGNKCDSLLGDLLVVVAVVVILYVSAAECHNLSVSEVPERLGHYAVGKGLRAGKGLAKGAPAWGGETASSWRRPIEGSTGRSGSRPVAELLAPLFFVAVGMNADSQALNPFA